VCGDVWNFFVMSCDVIHVNMNMPGMTWRNFILWKKIKFHKKSVIKFESWKESCDVIWRHCHHLNTKDIYAIATWEWKKKNFENYFFFGKFVCENRFIYCFIIHDGMWRHQIVQPYPHAISDLLKKCHENVMSCDGEIRRAEIFFGKFITIQHVVTFGMIFEQF
jgi:hypothetical protein